MKCLLVTAPSSNPTRLTHSDQHGVPRGRLMHSPESELRTGHLPWHARWLPVFPFSLHFRVSVLEGNIFMFTRFRQTWGENIFPDAEPLAACSSTSSLSASFARSTGFAVSSPNRCVILQGCVKQPRRFPWTGDDAHIHLRLRSCQALYDPPGCQVP